MCGGKGMLPGGAPHLDKIATRANKQDVGEHPLASLRELRFCPVEVCLRRERCREGCAQVSAGAGVVLGEGAYGAARESDVSESRSKCVIPILLTWDGLECVDLRRDLIFGDI